VSDDLIPADVKDNYRRLVAEGGQTWATVAGERRTDGRRATGALGVRPGPRRQRPPGRGAPSAPRPAARGLTASTEPLSAPGVKWAHPGAGGCTYGSSSSASAVNPYRRRMAGRCSASPASSAMCWSSVTTTSSYQRARSGCHRPGRRLERAAVPAGSRDADGRSCPECSCRRRLLALQVVVDRRSADPHLAGDRSDGVRPLPVGADLVVHLPHEARLARRELPLAPTDPPASPRGREPVPSVLEDQLPLKLSEDAQMMCIREPALVVVSMPCSSDERGRRPGSRSSSPSSSRGP
jgi:hypothetical protein